MSAQEHNGRELSLREAAALLWVLSDFAECELDMAESLHEQVTALRVVGGTPTMLELSVPTAVPTIALPDGPLPVRAICVDESGGPTGEVIVWVADGRLSGFEHAWYADEPPGRFPRPRELRTG